MSPQLSDALNIEKITALPFDQQYDTAWFTAQLAHKMSYYHMPTLVVKKDELAVAIFFLDYGNKEYFYESFKKFPLNPVDHFLFICEAYALETTGALDDIIGQAQPSKNPRSRETLMIYGETKDGQRRSDCIPTDGKGPLLHEKDFDNVDCRWSETLFGREWNSSIVINSKGKFDVH